MTMTAVRHVAVIDIGKTNAKVALVDLDRLAEIAVRKTPNTVLQRRPLSALRLSTRLWAFILDSLGALNRERAHRRDLGHHAWRGGGAARRGRQIWRCRCSTMSMTGPEHAGRRL